MRVVFAGLLLIGLTYLMLSSDGVQLASSGMDALGLPEDIVPEVDMSYDRSDCNLQRDLAQWQQLSVIEKLAAARCEIPEDQLVPP